MKLVRRENRKGWQVTDGSPAINVRGGGRVIGEDGRVLRHDRQYRYGTDLHQVTPPNREIVRIEGPASVAGREIQKGETLFGQLDRGNAHVESTWRTWVHK